MSSTRCFEIKEEKEKRDTGHCNEMQVLEENMSKRRVGGRESQEDAEGTNFKETSHEMIPHIEVEEEEVVCCKTSGVSSKTKYAAASFLPHPTHRKRREQSSFCGGWWPLPPPALTHRKRRTHPPWRVGLPAWWAESNFPRVSNLAFFPSHLML